MPQTSIAVPVFRMAFTAFALLWLSYPPVGWGFLAWLALTPLTLLVFPQSLHATRPLRDTYWAALLFWLATFYFLPYPHPVLFVGWFALSAYLAVYTPLFIVCARTLTHRMGVSPLVSIPVAWTGLEWIRVNFLTGFGMVCLSHTQYQHPLLIQISDLFGAYGVTFMIAAFAAGTGCVYHAWANNNTPSPASGRRLDLQQVAFGLLWSFGAITITAGYGWLALIPIPTEARPSTRVALIQSALDTVLTQPTSQEARVEKRDNDFQHCMEITHRAREADSAIDLVVWPESAFPLPDILGSSSDPDAQAFAASLRSALAAYWDKGVNDVGLFERIPLIAGTTTLDAHDESTIFNAAILIDQTGAVTQRYFKNHRVMVGEYIPVLEHFPEVMKLLPIGRALTPGNSSCVVRSGAIGIAPNVCFETTVPHLLRNQLNSLAAEGHEVDAMLNITNDGWFFGSSCLDLHFACNVFRAVEMRKPALVCANTGFSAQIAANGRVIQKGPRRKSAFIICDVMSAPNQNLSLYRRWGNWVPFVMGWICVASLIFARWRR